MLYDLCVEIKQNDRVTSNFFSPGILDQNLVSKLPSQAEEAVSGPAGGGDGGNWGGEHQREAGGGQVRGEGGARRPGLRLLLVSSSRYYHSNAILAVV